MDYCGPRSIPVGHFLGGPPVWDQFSRDSALAWHARDRRRHTGPGQCGMHAEDWADDDGNELDEDRLPFTPEATFCRGCELIQNATKRASDDHGHLPPGVHMGWQHAQVAAASEPDDEEP